MELRDFRTEVFSEEMDRLFTDGLILVHIVPGLEIERPEEITKSRVRPLTWGMLFADC